MMMLMKFVLDPYTIDPREDGRHEKQTAKPKDERSDRLPPNKLSHQPQLCVVN